MTSPQMSSPLSAAPGLLAQGKLDEAAALARNVLADAPDNADAQHLLGAIALRRGAYEEAVRLIAAALRLKPGMALALYNHGTALMNLKRYEEALISLDQALALRPTHVEARVNRAISLHGLERLPEALRDLDAALAANPNQFEAHLARGNALIGLQRWQEADAALAAALRVQPNSAAALNSRGVALAGLNDHAAALASFTKALANDPSSMDSLDNRAKALRHLGRMTEARNDLVELLKRQPGRPEAAVNLLLVQLALWDWSSYARVTARASEQFLSGPANLSPFEGFLLLPTAQDQYAYAQRYVARHLTRGRAVIDPPPHDKVHVAYVSADFHEHPVTRLIAGVLESHDRARFHVTAVAIGPPRSDESRRRIEAAADRFLVVNDPDDLSAAATLRQETFDIAVDLGGYTRYSRTTLFAHGIAPVQVLYLGYTGSTGGAFMDYVLADRHVVPEHEHRFYSERVVYLPDTYQANDARRVVGADARTRRDHGLPETGFVFCCFNNPHKLSPPVFDAWVRIMNAVPGSVLWLPDAGEEACGNLRCEAQARGFDPSRLIFAPRLPRAEDHLARLRHADLALDTLPYNGHTTLSDALWAGVPGITCRGDSFVARVGTSLLYAVGLPELVTSTLDDYTKLAVTLATDAPRFTMLRQKLAARDSSPLFDTARFTRHLEAAFAGMHERRVRGVAPESFSVARIS